MKNENAIIVKNTAFQIFSCEACKNWDIKIIEHYIARTIVTNYETPYEYNTRLNLLFNLLYELIC